MWVAVQACTVPVGQHRLRASCAGVTLSAAAVPAFLSLLSEQAIPYLCGQTPVAEEVLLK